MKYKSPTVLEEFVKWERKFAKEVPYLGTPSGLYLGFSEKPGGYMCTPLDSYTIAYTGGDGEHFAILTDFGLQEDLNNAPVISVFPMNLEATRNVRIVARNVSDFLWLYLNHELLLINEYNSEEEYVEHMKKETEDQSTDYFNHRLWLEQKEVVKKVVQEVFQFPVIPNPYQYIQDLRGERGSKVILKTKDTLGILPFFEHTIVQSHPWAQEAEIPDDLTDELGLFFESAPLETKLAFIRDYQADTIQNRESLLIICKELERNGFIRESKMLSVCMEI